MELCLDEIRAELAGSSAVLSEVEKVRLRELIDEVSQLVSGAIRRQTAVLPGEADLHWIKIAIRAAQVDCETLSSRQLAIVTSGEAVSADGPDRQPEPKPSDAATSEVALRLVHSTPVVQSKRSARSSTLRLVSRIAAALAIAVSMGALLTQGGLVSPRSGHLASQPRAIDQPAAQHFTAVKRFAVVSTPD